MSMLIDRTAHERVEEIFNQLGSAINELQIYTEKHPRFARTAETITSLITAFFEGNPRSTSLTITLRFHHLAFRNVPLVNLNAHGRKLLAALDECECHGLQFKPGISTEEIGRLIRTLITYTRPTSNKTEPPTASPDARYAFIYGLGTALTDEVHDDEESSGGSLNDLVPEFRAAAQATSGVATAYKTLFGNIHDGDAISLNALKKATSRAVAIATEHDLSRTPAPIHGYFRDFTVRHSINVCLLTTRAASLVIKSEERLHQIAVAALLHDIGKSRISKEILEKPGRLDPDESSQLRNHGTLGAEILLGLAQVDPLSVRVAYGHHLRQPVDGPRAIRHGFDPDWVTRLVAVTDVFETLTAARPYKHGLSAESAFQAMLHMSTLESHRPLIKLLYESLGRYPVGTFVELNTGERGVVLAMNRDHPSQPTVRILCDGNREPLGQPLDIDLVEAAWGRKEPRTVAHALVRGEPHEGLLDMVPLQAPEEILGSSLNDEEALMEREG